MLKNKVNLEPAKEPTAQNVPHVRFDFWKYPTDIRRFNRTKYCEKTAHLNKMILIRFDIFYNKNILAFG